MKFLKKLFNKSNDEFESRKQDETGIHIATLNWFIHVLIKNVGHNKWVKMTADEQVKYDKECPYNAGYPYKVVTTPIPAGKTIVLKESGTLKIKCDSEFTRNLIIEMARQYDILEKHYYFQLKMNGSEPWRPVSELKLPTGIESSRPDSIRYLVSSPTLQWMGLMLLGQRKEGVWYIHINGKLIQHDVKYYKILPPSPELKLSEFKYEDLKPEIDRIKKEAGINY